jgi:hypothetical protein
MKRSVAEMTALIQNAFNPDGTVKIQNLTTLPKDTSVTAASGSVRVETNLGPINVLIV